MISLAALKSQLSKMTPGDWEVDYDSNDQANIFARNLPNDSVTDWIAILPHQCVRSIEEQQEHNALGIVAAREAIGVLVELAEAALELRRAQLEADIKLNANTRYPFAECVKARGDLAKAQLRYHDALAKVSP